ncbi:MAG: lamin tail domain-containing protein, partial [Candidatus Marinimicrobia bacterium]|nr:lamin tail domain-containing protein [Candidatus Neomarinimicrobiota bacterium]
MRKAIAFLTVFVMSISLFAQTDVAKYGDKGAPEVRIPQTWNSNNNRTEDFLLVLTDSYGDGWDGAYMDVLVNGTLVYDDITVASGSSAEFTLAVDDGDIVQTAYTSGSYEGEHSYAFYDNNGTLVASDGPSPSAGIEFTVSITTDVPGCMTATACNYSADATADDGSCCLTNCTTIAMGGGSYISETSWEITDAAGNIIASGAGTTSSEFSCFDDGDYTVTAADSYGDGWNGNFLTVTDDDGTVYLSFEVTGAAGAGEVVTATFTVGALPPPPAPAVFFSEYAEGSSNNKYLEIYNGTGSTVDLVDYLVLGNYNGNPFNDTLRFPAGTALADGDVFVVAHEDASAGITALADSLIESPYANGTSYIAVFNGDDVRALVHISGTDSAIIDIIGTLEGGDPGDGWDVAGVTEATKDHTLVRKDAVMEGNGNWATSAGTTADDSEYIVGERPTADYTPATLGWHINAPCAANLLTINMYDSYGDGWNGNVLTIGTVELTIESGAAAFAELCLVDGTYLVTCGGGSYQSEVSWEIVNAAGEVLLAGGAPYSDVLQLGETTDVLGCTDADALNFDENATVDDGSCYYTGDSCSIALAAVVGANDASGADQWFTYTATLTGTMTVSSAGAGGDTKVWIYADCAGLLIDFDDDGLGWPPGESELTIDVVTGTAYYIMWDASYAPGPFTWMLEEALPSTNPENLTAVAGVESVSLEWDGVVPATNRSTAIVQEKRLTIEDTKERNMAKMRERKGDEPSEVHIFGVVNSNYVSNSRSTDVIIECDGGAWQSEVSWEILNDAGEIVASGGAPSGQLTASLDNGVYTVNGYDSYGDGWQGNALTVTGATDGAPWLYFTFEWNALDGGDSATTTFTMSDTPPELANLNMSNAHYDAETDAIMLTIHNTGGSTARFFYINYYLSNETSGDCQNEDYDMWSFADYLEADSSLTYPILEDASYWMGYGTFDIGAFIDWECTVSETDETDNTITTTIEIIDPFIGVTWNVYRSDAGAEFASVGVVESDAVAGAMSYVDENLTGDIEYCYYVTQVNVAGAAESDTSNHACATAVTPVDLPVPTELTAAADGWDVALNWVAPSTGGGDPIVSEDFEDGTLGVLMDDTGEWMVSATGPAPESSTYAWISDDANGNGAVATDATLWTADLAVETPGNFTLNFNVYYPQSGGDCASGGAWSDEAFVWAAIDGGAPTLVETIPGEFGTWNNLTVSLGYATTSVKAGIQYTDCGGNWAYYIAVDDVTISPSADFLLQSYNVYRDSVVVGTAPSDAVSWDEFIIVEGDYTYYATAMYDVYGESDPSNSVTVTVNGSSGLCNAPENLMAESLSNDVSLSWDAPEGGAGWFGYNDGTLVTSVGTNSPALLSVAIRFGQEELADYNGMSLTKVRFAHNEPTAFYQVAIWTAEFDGEPVLVDTSEWMDGADIPAGEWYDVELDENITIDWTQELWFGYIVDTPTGLPAACDGGPAVTGYGDLLAIAPVNEFVSINAAYGLNYNWMIDGFADYADGRSISSMAPITVDYQNPNTTSEPVEHRLPTPIVLNTPDERNMTNYVVYRDGEAEDTLGIGDNTYNDVDVEWGDHSYYVTALYNIS